MNQEFRNDSPMRLIKWIVSLANSIISLLFRYILPSMSMGFFSLFLQRWFALDARAETRCDLCSMLTKYSFQNYCLFILNLNISTLWSITLGWSLSWAGLGFCSFLCFYKFTLFYLMIFCCRNINYALPPNRVCACNNRLCLEFSIAILECCSVYVDIHVYVHAY